MDKKTSDEINDCVDRIENNVNQDIVEVHDAKAIAAITPITSDPFVDTRKYLSKKDVYEIFKGITWNLVLKRPKDPIKNMIIQLREYQSQNTSTQPSNNLK